MIGMITIGAVIAAVYGVTGWLERRERRRIAAWRSHYAAYSRLWQTDLYGEGDDE